jgi:hypothetical protein
VKKKAIPMQLMAGMAVEEIQVVIEILYDLSKKHRSQKLMVFF